MTTTRIAAAFVLSLFAVACKGAAPLPAKAIELNRTGVEALEQGDLETADARFALALEYNPHFVEPLVNQGLVELQRGNFRHARQLLARAKRLNSDIAQPHHGLGVLAEREHRPDVASKHYREALAVDPGFAPSRQNLARLLFAAGQYEHARVEFKRLVEVAPDQPAGYSGLAECLLHLNRVPEADAIVREGYTKFPDSAELVMLQARTLLRGGNPDAAVEMLTPLAGQRDDTAVVALGWLATAELLRHKPRFAVGAAKKALALDPHDPVAVYALAAALTELRDPGAPAWVARAKQLAPGSIPPDVD
jgi:tetratricopeptide (TPR) repeat protein